MNTKQLIDELQKKLLTQEKVRSIYSKGKVDGINSAKSNYFGIDIESNIDKEFGVKNLLISIPKRERFLRISEFSKINGEKCYWLDLVIQNGNKKTTINIEL